MVGAAAILRAAGYACPVVSVGSTPTFMSARSFDGLTEFRAGVCVFFDLFQAGVGVCGTDEIALSVLATVIGHQPEKGWTITDAGWMAMSRDRGTASQAVDQGYGVVCDLDGAPLGDLIVVGANQEHGIVAPRPGSGAAGAGPADRGAGAHPAEPRLRHRRAVRPLPRRPRRRRSSPSGRGSAAGRPASRALRPSR